MGDKKSPDYLEIIETLYYITNIAYLIYLMIMGR